MRFSLLVVWTALLISTSALANNHNHDHHGRLDKVAGVGTLDAINAEAGTIVLSHGPIAAVDWPAMTMEMPATRQVDLSALAVGQKVQFLLKKGRDNRFRVVSLCPAQSDDVTEGLCDSSKATSHNHH